MIGQEILHYKILEKLGEGGMGVVYKAEDTRLKRTVALKFLSPGMMRDEEARKRFIHEAQAASALDHPNICTIYEIEEAGGQTFIAMAYYDGETLKKKIERGPMPTPECLDLAMQIANGLSKAHDKGIIHRDIKPANVIVTSNGIAKILDFGLAKAASATKLTKACTPMGTVAYMSPEQSQGTTVDHRTDIWALGVVLYEMLTGQTPFKGDHEQAIIYSILSEAPEAMTDVAPEVEQILTKALAKNPDDRYQSADELLQTIPGTTRPAKRRRRSRWIAAAVILLIAAASYVFRLASDLVHEKDVVKTIAVLPFADLSPNKDQEYFSDGLSEELLNTLAKNRQLRVTSRISAFYFKDKDVDLKTITRKLNVKHILDGSVRKDSNTLRITARLIDVETDSQLWSETYDGSLDNILALQDAISGSVAEALKVALLAGESVKQQRETNPEAYNAYLLGKHFYNLRGKEHLQKAASSFEQTLRIDPWYAPAWVGLSRTHAAQADLVYVTVDEGYRKARQEVEKALEIDPNLADAHSMLGWIMRSYEWDWSGADKSHQRALQLEPGDAGVMIEAANLASTFGRFEEAIKLIRNAVELDPLSISGYYYLGLYCWYVGLLDESIDAFKKCLELNPSCPQAHMRTGLIYLEKGQQDSTLAEIKRESAPPWQLYGFALAYHAQGMKKEADDTLAAFVEKWQSDMAFQIAEIYAYRGDIDKSFEWLKRAYDQRDIGCAYIKSNPLLRSIEKDPRYAVFMKKMKLQL